MVLPEFYHHDMGISIWPLVISNTSHDRALSSWIDPRHSTTFRQGHGDSLLNKTHSDFHRSVSFLEAIADTRSSFKMAHQGQKRLWSRIRAAEHGYCWATCSGLHVFCPTWNSEHHVCRSITALEPHAVQVHLVSLGAFHCTTPPRSPRSKSWSPSMIQPVHVGNPMS